MAKRKTTSQLPIAELIVSKDEFKKTLDERIAIGEKIYNRQFRTQQDFDDAKDDFSSWSDYNSELLKQSFSEQYNEYKKSYDSAGKFSFIIIGGRTPSQEQEIEDFNRKVKSKLDKLKMLKTKTDLLKSSIPEMESIPIEAITVPSDTDDVFIVHGHNDKVKIDVARTLDKLGLNPIILHEQPNSGKTIIEKFEKYSNVSFAIILLTDDDMGKAKENINLNPRARQNVVLEMGYFIGKLGRERVFILYTPGVELPSDLSGLLYTKLENNDNWKLRLVKELKAFGYDVDANRIL